MAAILGPGGPSTTTYLPQMVRRDLFWGDHLWHDRPIRVYGLPVRVWAAHTRTGSLPVHVWAAHMHIWDSPYAYGQNTCMGQNTMFTRPSFFSAHMTKKREVWLLETILLTLVQPTANPNRAFPVQPTANPSATYCQSESSLPSATYC